MVSALALIRIGVNFIYLPLMEKNNKDNIYRDHVWQITQITKASPVYFTGDPITLEPVYIHRFKLADNELVVPPKIPYNVPYYLMKTNGHIMEYHPKPQKGNYYMAYEDFIGDNKILYQFRESWTGEELYLFRVD
jgi:hypothetical protein